MCGIYKYLNRIIVYITKKRDIIVAPWLQVEQSGAVAPTPEERHVANMQINGYENPTYKYFETIIKLSFEGLRCGATSPAVIVECSLATPAPAVSFQRLIPPAPQTAGLLPPAAAGCRTDVHRYAVYIGFRSPPEGAGERRLLPPFRSGRRVASGVSDFVTDTKQKQNGPVRPRDNTYSRFPGKTISSHRKHRVGDGARAHPERPRRTAFSLVSVCTDIYKRVEDSARPVVLPTPDVPVAYVRSLMTDDGRAVRASTGGARGGAPWRVESYKFFSVYTVLHNLRAVSPLDNDANFRFQRHTIAKEHWRFLENVQHVLDFRWAQAHCGESFNFKLCSLPTARMRTYLMVTKNRRRRTKIYTLPYPSGWLLGYYFNAHSFRSLAAEIRANKEIDLALASSGIAATLINGGRTAHSDLKLPLNVEWLRERIILATKNDIVHGINNITQEMIPGEEKMYMSIDTLTDEQESINFPTEYLNSLNIPGMPLHCLKLKKHTLRHLCLKRGAYCACFCSGVDLTHALIAAGKPAFDSISIIPDCLRAPATDDEQQLLMYYI
ncbi:hypothetical protein EVAR_21402_1 [Eumeta japonica]|uniref:ATP-dependent DNA helicase n=1 Tax=Eumeta variegata TaxID=151549 RepID=A0A4C1VHT9_EUMVA|nr:hypothetical protein EVAR_21402_1 [Eumeta japonica]